MAEPQSKIGPGGQPQSVANLSPPPQSIIGAGGQPQSKAPSRRSRRSRTPSAPQVLITGDSVLIDGKGFSVLPGKQEEFIRSMTGGRGTSAQSALAAARISDAKFRSDQAREQRQEQIAAIEPQGFQAQISQQTPQFAPETPKPVPSIGQGVARRMGAIESTADRLPTPTRDVGEVPASVPGLQNIEGATGPDAVEARTPQPLTIEPFDPSKFAQAKEADVERKGFFQAVGEVIRGETLPETGEAAKKVVRLEGGVGEVVGEFLAPFKQVGRRAGDAPISIPQFGTVSAAAPEGVVTTTPRELASEVQIESGTDPALAGLSREARVSGAAGKARSDVVRKFQSKIDADEISVGEAQVQAQSELSERVGDIVSRELPDPTGFETRTGAKAVSAAEIATEVAAFGLAGRAGPGSRARAVDRGALKELAAKGPTRLTGKVSRDLDDAFLTLRGGRATPSAKQAVEVEGKIFDLGDVDDISRASFRGRGRATTELDSFVKRIEGFKPSQAKITTTEDFGIVSTAKGKKSLGEVLSAGGRAETKAVQSRGFVDVLPERSVTNEFIAKTAKAPKKTKGIPRLADPDSAFAKRIEVIRPKVKAKDLSGRRRSKFIGVADSGEKELVEFVSGQAKKVRIDIPTARATTLADIDARGAIKQVSGESAGKVFSIGSKTKPAKDIGAVTLQKLAQESRPRISRAVRTVLPGIGQAAKQALKVRPQTSRGVFSEFAAPVTTALTKRSATRSAPRALQKQQPIVKLDARRGQSLAAEIVPISRARTKSGQRPRSRSLAATANALDSLSESQAKQVSRSAFRKASKQKTRQTGAGVFPLGFRDSFRVGRVGAGLKVKPRIAFDLDDQISPRKKKKKTFGDEADFFVTGFTEKVFGIKKKITRKEARRIARSGDPFQERAIPQFLD